MRVLGREVLDKARKKHAELRKALGAWVRVVESSSWKSMDDLRKTYASADLVGDKFVFSIKGNRYRLVATVAFGLQTLIVEHVLTHNEDTKGKWK